MHVVSKSDPIHEEKKPLGNRKSLVRLLQRMKQWKIHQLYFTLRTCMGIFKNGRKTSTRINQEWKTVHCKSENCAPLVVPGVIVDTSPRSDVNAASGDRPPTSSGDREQNIPNWLQPFTEGLVEGKYASSGSAGETIAKTLPPFIPARLSHKSGWKHNLFIHFLKDPACDICKRTTIAKNREDRTPRAIKNLAMLLQRVSEYSTKRTNRDCTNDLQ